jgi:trigger factor
MELPELTHEFLHRFGVHSPAQLDEALKTALQRQQEFEQRKSAREQVLRQIAEAANWELPQDLVTRQTRKTLARQVMQLRSAGYSEDEIRSRAAVLEQNAAEVTERALKERFVLQKIAEVEKIDLKDEDIQFEIEMIAQRTGESARRVRARLEKDDLLETLATEVLEGKALDLVLENANYEDVPLETPAAVGAVEVPAVPDTGAEAPAAPSAADQK